MSNSLKSQIQSDMKDAMRAKEKARLGVIRMLLAALQSRELVLAAWAVTLSLALLQIDPNATQQQFDNAVAHRLAFQPLM